MYETYTGTCRVNSTLCNRVAAAPCTHCLSWHPDVTSQCQMQKRIISASCTTVFACFDTNIRCTASHTVIPCIGRPVGRALGRALLLRRMALSDANALSPQATRRFAVALPSRPLPMRSFSSPDGLPSGSAAFLRERNCLVYAILVPFFHFSVQTRSGPDPAGPISLFSLSESLSLSLS